ncbi:unnamed protein product [Effrenium voratum]|nr:unnamed protein product [Effrenium voratum]
MKHGSVYFGGLSRGDTPPKEIPTLGAAGGRPKLSDMTLKEMEKGCPYARDEHARVPARHEGMSLDVIKKSDVPPGPILFTKEYDRSLVTEDLDRAQPVLSHPTSWTGTPVPWNQIHKEELEEVPKSRSKVLYPPIRRRQDLSLKTSDIEYAQAKKPIVRERRRSNCIVDPLTHSYQFASSELPQQPEYRASGRCTLDVSDIDGSQPQPLVPKRRDYGEPMKLEDEFRNPRHKAVLAAAMASLGGTPRQFQAASRRVDGYDVRSQYSPRTGHPLEPTYQLPVADAATSLHVRFQSERHEMGDDPPCTKTTEVGFVRGSKPKTGIRDNGAVQTSLCTSDLPGATPQRRVGALPVHLYGPKGNRPLSTCLDSSDIDGAQADTRRARRTPRA